MNGKTTLLMCAAALLLGGCARQGAAFYMIGGDNRHSLSLMREAYPWSSGWEVKLVTANGPRCQRRHELKDVPEEDFKVDPYEPEPEAFILNQGTNWYVTEMGKCGFQQFQVPPPAPGKLIGQFVEKNAQLVFVDASGKATPETSITR